MAQSASSRLTPAQGVELMLTKGLDEPGDFVCAPTQGGGYSITSFEKTRDWDLSWGKKLVASSEPSPETKAYRTEKALNLRKAILAELGKETVNMKTVEKLAIKFGKQLDKGRIAPSKLNWGYAWGSDPARDAAFKRARKNAEELLTPSSSSSKPISDAAQPVLVELLKALDPTDVAAGGAPSRLMVLKEAEATWRFLSATLQGLDPASVSTKASEFVIRRQEAVALNLEALSGEKSVSGWSRATSVLTHGDLPLLEAAIRELRMEWVVWSSRSTPAEVASAKNFGDRGIQVVWLQSLIVALLKKHRELEAQATKASGNPGKPAQVPSPQATAGAASDLQTVQKTLVPLYEQLLRLVSTVHGFRNGEKGVTEDDHFRANESINPVMAEVSRLERLQKQLLAAHTANATTTTANLAPGPTSATTTTSTSTTNTTAATPTTTTTTTTNTARSGSPTTS